jgi:hypothetical protein
MSKLTTTTIILTVDEKSDLKAIASKETTNSTIISGVKFLITDYKKRKKL